MAKKQAPGAPPEKIALYDKALAAVPGIERKGAVNAYTSLNGHMFSYMGPAGVMSLRLPEGEREKFLKKYKTKLFESYGIIQKEYVTVPDPLLAKTVELAKYISVSVGYVRSLKPKTTTRKK